jgi:hypothetical protein
MLNLFHKNRISKRQRLAPDAGIAIGMILFVIALLGVIAVALTSGNSSVGSNISADNVRTTLKSQGNLIRSKILECNQYLTDPEMGGTYADKYPSSTGTGTAIASVTCAAYPSGQQNIWSGAHPAALGNPPTGMSTGWYYVNASSSGGGRCIRIQPDSPIDAGVKSGIAQAASGFSAMEINYDPNSASQRFILWITSPTGSASADCAP